MKLHFFSDHFQEQIESYNIDNEQLRFTRHPLDCIELSKHNLNRHSIVAIENEELVTFFVLHEKEGVIPYSNNPNAILLRAFSTDKYQQGKGYAKQALSLLPEFVKENFNHINEIVLAVNIQNVVAQGLYNKCGFVDEGVRNESEKGALIIMSYYL